MKSPPGGMRPGWQFINSIIKGEKRMKRKRTRLTVLALTVLLLVGTLAGCAGQNNSGGQSSGDEKIKISMYLWDRSKFKEFTPWL